MAVLSGGLNTYYVEYEALTQIMPSVHSMAYIAASQIGDALKQDGVASEVIDSIIKSSAKTFAQELYGQESSSHAVQELNGRAGHYLSVLQENERLHEALRQANPEAPSANLTLNSIFSTRACSGKDDEEVNKAQNSLNT